MAHQGRPKVSDWPTLQRGIVGVLVVEAILLIVWAAWSALAG